MALPKIQGEAAKLWKEPALKYTASGKAVCDLPLVFTDRKKNDQGVWEDSGTLWVRATAWDAMAENCANSLAKGDLVIVTGKLSMREYERSDGSKGQQLELQLYEVGASLRWSEAKVQRVERSSTTSKPADDPWAADTSEAPF